MDIISWIDISGNIINGFRLGKKDRFQLKKCGQMKMTIWIFWIHPINKYNS